MADSQSFHWFGGKGGSGKTTLATAFAFDLVERFPKDKILLVSSDRSGGLSDLLRKKLSARPLKVLAGKTGGSLSAAELDFDKPLARFVDEVLPSFEKGVTKGKFLGASDVKTIFRESGPGMETFLALLELSSLITDGTYDRIVVDGESTTQILRTLEVPAYFRKWLASVRGEKGGKSKKEALPPSGFDAAVDKLEALLTLLKDRTRSAFHVVAVAEPVAESQTRMLLTQLKERGIAIGEVLVNLIENHQGCSTCMGRRGLEAPHVRKLQQWDKSIPVRLVGRREAAPLGVESIKAFALEIFKEAESKALEFSPAEGPPALVRAPSMPPISAPPLPPTRMLFFVGQGGVGKSSCAAAAAVTLTEKEGPVLLISTEPSHSLSEILQNRLTDTESQVKGTKGLYARELDGQIWFNAFRRRLKEKVEPLFESDVKGSPSSDREILKNLIDLVPIALLDFPALSILTDAVVQERFKRIVIDPGPSGRSVRLVDLPNLARPWLSAVLAILNKFRSKGMGPIADEISRLLQQVSRFEAALVSPTESRFVVVTRGEELASERTEELVAYLREKKVSIERIVVNRVLPKIVCPKCEERRKNELLVAKNVEKQIGLPVTLAPALGRHPAGLRELKAFRTSWCALSAFAKIKAA